MHTTIIFCGGEGEVGNNSGGITSEYDRSGSRSHEKNLKAE